MTEICALLGMTTSTAFHILANTFGRAHCMPFSVKSNSLPSTVTHAQMLSDADNILSAFAQDYKRMAK